MNSFDLVVIGAGPAGTSAAITAAQCGLRVALIERSKFPRHKVGETLHPGVEPLLRQLGVWDEVCKQEFIRHDSVAFHHQGQTTVSPYGHDLKGPWLGLQAWREDFDDLLMRKCQQMGVCLWQPCSVSEAIISDGAVIGVETNRGTILAETVIDASGSRRWLARQLNLAAPAESHPLVAKFGYAVGKIPPTFIEPQFSVVPDGWLWIARVRPDTCQWTRLSGLENPRTSTTHESQWPNELHGLAIQGGRLGVRSADVTWRCVTRSAGNGYFLCGDASSVLDPSASHGVLKALMSGIYAASLAGQIKKCVNSMDACAAEYSRWVNSLFHHDIIELKKRYSDLGLKGLYVR